MNLLNRRTFIVSSLSSMFEFNFAAVDTRSEKSNSKPLLEESKIKRNFNFSSLPSKSDWKEITTEDISKGDGSKENPIKINYRSQETLQGEHGFYSVYNSADLQNTCNLIVPKPNPFIPILFIEGNKIAVEDKFYKCHFVKNGLNEKGILIKFNHKGKDKMIIVETDDLMLILGNRGSPFLNATKVMVIRQ